MNLMGGFVRMFNRESWTRFKGFATRCARRVAARGFFEKSAQSRGSVGKRP